MKIIPKLNQLQISSTEDAFQAFVSSLRPSLKLWDYFVNWDKVFRNTQVMEIHLNIWNYLLGKDNFEMEFDELLRQHPQIVAALPSMVVRDGSGSRVFSMIQDISNLKAPEALFDFTKPADSQRDRADALEFVNMSGLRRLFEKDGVKNLVDYVLGVEAGIDSNGRKNRSGTSMETVVKEYLTSYCKNRELDFIDQATPTRIKERWGFAVPVDKSSRRFDFAVSDGVTLALIEVNFYGGGGSKLKATAGEYVGLDQLLDIPNVNFVWITDGQGWLTTLHPLRAAFEKIDFVWNLAWLGEDLLDDLFPLHQTPLGNIQLS